MNDYLIKNYKYSTFKDVLFLIISYVSIVYLFSINEIVIVFLGIFMTYRTLKRKILLEIKQKGDCISFISYSIIGKKKELILDFKQIKEIDFDGDLIINYENDYEKTIGTYKLNAEPWNNLYEQIKEFKIAYQEFEKFKMEM